MQEYILGNIFGITQVLIGHPFDTLKTNIQNSISTRIFLQKPYKLYRGFKYPFIMNSIGTSFLFGNYNYFYTKTHNNILSGILTGFISAIALTPFDYKKIQSQTDILLSYNSRITKNKQSLIKIFKKYYNGFSYTLAREVIAIPIYFYTYEYLNEKYQINPFFAGGIAGINSWLFTYPLDTLKTRSQLYQSKTLKDIIKMGSLFNGLGITLVRAFIVNSTSFYIYELLKKIQLSR
jgi:solute carrier family 25 (mitochondrial carnitine/acylcarnitine transporter), member 20/29